MNGGKETSVCKGEGGRGEFGGNGRERWGEGGEVFGRKHFFFFFLRFFLFCDLPGHEVPSWGCWGCVGGAVRGGTAESRVVPLRKKSDIREGRGQQGGGGAVGYTCRKYAARDDQRGGEERSVCVCVRGLEGSQLGGGAGSRRNEM